MNKKGFLATSILYSFFFVFIMIMVGNLALDVSRTRLEKTLKDDIRSEIENNYNFADVELPNNSYTSGETIHFAKEDWRVLKDDYGSITVMLDRSLNEDEITAALNGISSANTEYFESGMCNGSLCQIRQCKVSTVGLDACFYYNSAVFNKYSWSNTTGDNTYGSSIVKNVVENWFGQNISLQIAKSSGSLNEMTVRDNVFNNYSSYVRVPQIDELTSLSWASSYTMHTVNGEDTNVYVYNGSSSLVPATSSSYVYPVINIKKTI